MTTSKFEKGMIPWNKGKTGYHLNLSPEIKEQKRILFTGNKLRTGIKPINAFKEGHTPWHAGKKGIKKTSIETRKRLSRALMGNKNGAGYKPTKEQIRRKLKRNEKSSLEIKAESIFNELQLPYRFVGNGEVLIGRKSPDFVNTNGQKIAVEVYYRRHKEMFRKGLTEWKIRRELLFSKYGWEIVFLDETQVTKEIIIEQHSRGLL